LPLFDATVPAILSGAGLPLKIRALHGSDGTSGLRVEATVPWNGAPARACRRRYSNPSLWLVALEVDGGRGAAVAGRF